ncbi:hypothetical protein MHI39_19615 [Heyndrickxia sp. FSL K6-6286]|nr:hypothetical protein [Heyndrickxia oleronia]MCI1590888.1 hypothetical protein [Heyndrickxia oleronia]MCI1615725.1 hypothetical protein [Heyndrickxia oleronia]MCI1746357.1 hypothetical protein [Heyndrickxia oleronia]MEC1372947.1 hypothetical protein [Heyndrickxia oleronia]QQZ03843.1 hypothetical protein I5818_19210 [Heyndrickxia oleronia]
MIMNTIFIIAIIVAVFASIAAWLNTQIIVRELAEIKEKLGIKEHKKSSFLDRDLDND